MPSMFTDCRLARIIVQRFASHNAVPTTIPSLFARLIDIAGPRLHPEFRQRALTVAGPCLVVLRIMLSFQIVWCKAQGHHPEHASGSGDNDSALRARRSPPDCQRILVLLRQSLHISPVTKFTLS
jgi:hypothetical protein